MKKIKENKIVIYQSSSGAIELRGDVKGETIWATQAQVASAFGVNVRTVNEHIKNIINTGELSDKATIRKFRIVQNEGNRQIERDINHYNLDMVLSVGYRVNSKKATLFRIWATKTLREYINKGYIINRKQISKNYDSFIKTVESIQKLLPENITLDPKSVLELIKEFATTWVSLDAYDKESLKITGITKKVVKLTSDDLHSAILELKNELIKNGGATDFFARERERESIQGIVGNIMQSFGGKNLYETIEEKAAHLLYFIVKNHPFVDGNKRSGAFAFVWFLKKTKVKGIRNINSASLTALTLLIAESNPKNKEQMIALVTQLLR